MHLKTGMAFIVAAALAWQPAFADPPQHGPLSPGKAAGIRQAQQNGPDMNKMALVAAVGLGLVGVYLIVGTHYNNYHNPSVPATH